MTVHPKYGSNSYTRKELLRSTWRWPVSVPLLTSGLPCHMSSRTFDAQSALLTEFRPQPTNRTSPADLGISKAELHSWTGDHRGLVLEVREGAVWVTQSGDTEDVVLKKGDSFRVSTKGTVLAQGLGQRNTVRLVQMS